MLASSTLEPVFPRECLSNLNAAVAMHFIKFFTNEEHDARAIYTAAREKALGNQCESG